MSEFIKNLIIYRHNMQLNFFYQMDIYSINNILLHIFKFLPINDIHSSGLVNREFHKGYLSELNWKNVLDRDFYNDYNQKEISNYETYKYSHQLKMLGVKLKLKKTNRQIIQLEGIQKNYRQLQYISPVIGSLINLTNLNLAVNQIQLLPPEIGLLTKLEGLNLSINQIQSLPPEIGLLTNLEILCLFNNQLKSLPSEIGQLSNLIDIGFDENKLDSIPPEIGLLTKLRDLSLNDNQLQFIPSEIGLLTNLINLYLHKNKLQSLPSEIGSLERLGVFYADINLKPQYSVFLANNKYCTIKNK